MNTIFLDHFQRLEDIESIHTEDKVKRRIDIPRVQMNSPEAEEMNVMIELSSENPCGKVHVLPFPFTPGFIVGESGRLEGTFEVSTRTTL